MIASDGVWDVVTSDNVRQWSLCYKYHTPQDLATYIAFKARRRRLKQNLRIDDITVTVVDVNPQNAIFVKSEISRILEPTLVASSVRKSYGTSTQPLLNGSPSMYESSPSTEYSNCNYLFGDKTNPLRSLNNLCTPVHIGFNDVNHLIDENIQITSHESPQKLVSQQLLIHHHNPDKQLSSNNIDEEFVFRYTLSEPKNCILM